MWFRKVILSVLFAWQMHDIGMAHGVCFNRISECFLGKSLSPEDEIGMSELHIGAYEGDVDEAAVVVL